MIMIGLLILGAGFVLCALFALMNLRNVPRADATWRPAGAMRERSVAFGLASVAVLFAGVALFALGAAIIGTTMGYGRF